jgi:GMP synthase (glutamine-hydrolysing)
MKLIIDCGSSKTRFIEDMIDEFDDFTTIPILELDPSKLNDFNGVIISGAPILVTEQEISPYLEKIQWIKETQIPVLGICFGHQLIGILHGAFASRMKEDRDWQTIEILEENLLTDRLPNEFEMMEDHCETISIPPGFILLASSDACVNEAMKHKEKNIFGVQFHPEVSGNYGRTLFENFCRICEERNQS